MGQARKRVKPIKLNSRQRHTVKMPCGNEVAIIGRPIDGKPGVILELPEGATIRHESASDLTPPQRKP